jgi:hypothetical protein
MRTISGLCVLSCLLIGNALAENRFSSLILARGQNEQLTFWTMYLQNGNEPCSAANGVMYQGGTKDGWDTWSLGCVDGTLLGQRKY